MLSFLPFTFGIAAVLRFLHNRSCLLLKKKALAVYADVCRGEGIREQIAFLAGMQNVEKNQGNSVVPLYSLDAMLRNSGSDLSVEEASVLFLNAALKQAQDRDSLIPKPAH